jgi:cytochrome c-type biogenesis protein
VSGGVNTTVFAAFAVGFVSFISPCVLPLVPGYLSAVSGVSVAEMRERPQRRVLLPAIVFCLSFTLVFVALGLTATGLGATLKNHRNTLETVAGILLILMGLLFVATPLIPRLNREWRVDALMQRAGSGGPIIAGFAFAIAWTPCVGPTLGTILTAAAVQSTAGQAGLLLVAYSAGLAIPFLLTAVAFDRATTAFRWMRDRYVVITAFSGIVLIAMGVLLLSGSLADLNVEARKLLQHVGLDDLYSL